MGLCDCFGVGRVGLKRLRNYCGVGHVWCGLNSLNLLRRPCGGVDGQHVLFLAANLSLRSMKETSGVGMGDYGLEHLPD